MISVYVKLFNVILKSGHIPKDWAMGIILPIYKNTGPVTDQTTTEGSHCSAAFAILFTSVLNNRLTEYIDELGIMGKNKLDIGMIIPEWIVFVLNFFIDLYLNKRMCLYCAFVDYRKAFDTVNRTFLWLKLLSNNIGGNISTMIFNLPNHVL